jgi:membrane-bound ClpP family serine protease
MNRKTRIQDIAVYSFHFGMIALLWWICTIHALLGAILVILWMGSGFLLLAFYPSQEPSTDSQTAPSPLRHLIGTTAKAVSALRPTGKILIDGKHYKAKSTLHFISAGTTIKVVDAKQKLLIVEESHDTT